MDLGREFEALRSRPVVPMMHPGFDGSNVGLRLANSFHPQMWSVRVSRYKSPMDVFLDDRMLTHALERAWMLWPDRYGANEATLRRMLKTFPGAASVSNFRPTAARNIVGSLSNDGEAVLDFSAGYGGRLLGALSLARHYIGIDPCTEQVAGLRKALTCLGHISRIRGTAQILHGCAEDLLPTMPSRSFDLIFSSPPYYDWERYSHEPTQSFQRYRTYEEWLERFMRPTIEESYRLLRRKGRLALNLSGRLRRPSPDEAHRISTRAGFRLEYSSTIRFARIPYMHPRSAGPNKVEDLLIWTKP
jgi:SAM-dependent methyltransferase